MNQLNERIRILRVQIEYEKKLLEQGKGSDERLHQLEKELRECLT